MVDVAREIWVHQQYDENPRDGVGSAKDALIIDGKVVTE
jgi:hypothetical protein